MENLKLNNHIELIKFEKIDDETNICILFDSSDYFFLVAWDLQILKNNKKDLIYYVTEKTPKRSKAEEVMENLKKGKLIDNARREKVEAEKRRAWEEFKNQ